MNESMLRFLSFVPVMTWRRFADLAGIDYGVARGMCERGQLPVLRIGKHRFINLVELSNRCSLSSED
jgi:hypothetical protein